MGVGFSRLSGPGPLHRKSVSSQTSVSLPKSLSSSALQDILGWLGIDPSQVVSVRERPGGGDAPNFKDVQTLQVAQNTSETLKALGLMNTEAVISLQIADDIDRIEKRMKDIKKTLVKKEDFDKLSGLMGFDTELEGLILVDSDGGMQLVESFLDELEESI
jgi:hypothetical protein